MYLYWYDTSVGVCKLCIQTVQKLSMYGVSIDVDIAVSLILVVLYRCTDVKNVSVATPQCSTHIQAIEFLTTKDKYATTRL